LCDLSFRQALLRHPFQTFWIGLRGETSGSQYETEVIEEDGKEVEVRKRDDYTRGTAIAAVFHWVSIMH